VGDTSDPCALRSAPAATARGFLARAAVLAGAVIAGWIVFGGTGVAEAAPVSPDVPDHTTVRRLPAVTGHVLDTTLDTVDEVAEPTRPATQAVRRVLTPAFDAVGDVADPAVESVDEVITPDHGEPPSPERPGGNAPVLGVETPHPAVGALASTREPGGPSSGPPATQAPPIGGALVTGPAGPVAPAPPANASPGPSGAPLHGVVGSVSGLGSADRPSGAAADQAVSFVVSPRLVAQATTAEDAVAVRERARRPQVSPD